MKNIILIGLSITLSGCVGVNTVGSIETTSLYVPRADESDYGRNVPRIETTSHALEHWGEPDQKIKLDNGQEEWIYNKCLDWKGVFVWALAPIPLVVPVGKENTTLTFSADGLFLMQRYSDLHENYFLLTPHYSYKKFDFDPVCVPVLNGKLGVRMPNRNFTGNHAEMPFPSSTLDLTYSVSPEEFERVKEMTIQSVSCKGERSGSYIQFNQQSASFSTNRWSRGASAEVSYNVSEIKGLHTKGKGYENYNMEADVTVIYKDGSKGSEKVKFRMKTNFKKERRNTLLDNMMSV